jgi:hypothetical protein
MLIPGISVFIQTPNLSLCQLPFQMFLIESRSTTPPHAQHTPTALSLIHQLYYTFMQSLEQSRIAVRSTYVTILNFRKVDYPNVVRDVIVNRKSVNKRSISKRPTSQREIQSELKSVAHRLISTALYLVVLQAIIENSLQSCQRKTDD